jgi:hypothetical protein
MRTVEVDRIPVSTLVKTGAKVAAALVGSSVCSLVIFVVALFGQGGLAAALVGPQSGSSAAGLAFLIVPVAFFAAIFCWPVMGFYLYELFDAMESKADLGNVDRVTLASLGSFVLSVVVFIPVTFGLLGPIDNNVPVLSPEQALRYLPLAFCASWSMLGVYLFRKLKSRVPISR